MSNGNGQTNGLYSFTDSTDPNRILDRLKRLGQALPVMKGGKLVTPTKVKLPTARR